LRRCRAPLPEWKASGAVNTQTRVALPV